MKDIILISFLFIFSLVDYRRMKVPNWMLFIFLFVVLFSFFNLENRGWTAIDVNSMILICSLTFPGLYFSVFGASDVKILLIMALILSFSQMLDVLLYSFVCFAVYWWLFARGQKEAPFVPSLLVGVVASLWIL
ncbi:MULTISPECIES: prepilin peptidase [unclassified Photobacterium]|uniref:prepilin peptidase n=1 Tax=unclassified Photobacterium TaxID=2628852 RepID=UPI001EDBA5A0|nr:MULTISPECIES: prepilin peptidase [unclassified Photobacterium]MCG2845465.1 prepilin peptidase [Photobacterium sp. WH80]